MTMSQGIVILLFLITCHVDLKANGYLRSSRGRTPAPVHDSCTREVVDSLSCDAEGDMCGYQTFPDPRGREGLRFTATGPITSRINSRKYITVFGGMDRNVPGGSNAWMRAPLDDSTVEAICIEYYYRAVGFPILRLYNELSNGTRHYIGQLVDNSYPNWKLARFHACVAENSFLTFRASKRSDHTGLDLDNIRVTKSTMNCTTYRIRHAIIDAMSTTTETTTTTSNEDTVTAPNTSHSSSTGAPNKANATASHRQTNASTVSTQTCTGVKIDQLSCNFQKDLCGYHSRSVRKGSVEWRRDFSRTQGLYARLYDSSLNAPVGAGARLSGAIPVSNKKAVCIEFSYWGEHNTTIAVYNEKVNETDRLIGQITADNPDTRKRARFSSCVSKNSFISIESTKISSNPVWVGIDDLKVLESDMDCVESSSPTFRVTQTPRLL